ncbi:hypothetical protein FZEAL_8004 [Fusarium zealandicum]|uniref:Uncharacterized protein n=1 Tax=Fusarium zealandicum TaxID=1053134 RepID=A0A8H4UFB4_9HYPO|nr:hypothetical protein FZEAL_8004 [Fusarium zealandicum]
MAQGYAIFIGLVVIAALCAVSWFLSPKGENQVSVFAHPRDTPATLSYMLTSLEHCSLWRSSLILAIVSCYLMWAITFLAQLHPLIAPRRSGIREEYLD